MIITYEMNTLEASLRNPALKSSLIISGPLNSIKNENNLNICANLAVNFFAAKKNYDEAKKLISHSVLSGLENIKVKENDSDFLQRANVNRTRKNYEFALRAISKFYQDTGLIIFSALHESLL